MKWTWPCWRLIVENKATWTEVTTNMNIVDVMRMNEALNLVHTTAKKQRLKQKEEASKRK